MWSRWIIFHFVDSFQWTSFNKIKYLPKLNKCIATPHCENHFRRFCFILLLYLCDHIRWISFHQYSKYLSHEQHDLWTMRSSEYCKYFRQTLILYVYFQVFLRYFIYYYILHVPKRCMHSKCCISWCQTVWWCIT